MVLTSRQRKALNGAIVEYLSAQGFQDVAEALAGEIGIDSPAAIDVNDALSKPPPGILEKKWTTVLRLQKKIKELETKVQSLESDLANAGQGGRRRANKDKDPSKAIPRGPAVFDLAGHRSPVTAVAFHPNYTVMVSCSEDATLRVWDYETGDFEKQLKGHTNSVGGVAFSPSGALLASCSADLTVKLWDIETTYECIKTLKGHDHNVSSVCFLSNGKLASASRDKTVRIWNLESGYCEAVLEGHTEWVRRIVAPPDSPSLMLATASSDRSVRVWDAASSKCIASLHGHEHVVECVAFAPLSFSPTGKPVPSSSSAEASSSQTVARPQYVASGSRDKTIKVFHIETGQVVATLVGHANWVRGICFHSNGIHLISVSDDKSIKVWDVATNRCIRTIEDAHSHFIACVDFHPRDLRVVTGGVDNKVKVWSC